MQVGLSQSCAGCYYGSLCPKSGGVGSCTGASRGLGETPDLMKSQLKWRNSSVVNGYLTMSNYVRIRKLEPELWSRVILYTSC